MTKQSSRYLTAVFENQMLSIYTNDKFKDFEEEYQGSSEISLKMTFNCTEDTSEELVSSSFCFLHFFFALVICVFTEFKFLVRFSRC